MHKHLFIVTGPAGCGKSTVGQSLAKHSGFPFIEGDKYHPHANVDKMTKGIPLTDTDRWDWLIRLREEAVKQLDDGADGVIVSCSALKHKYRDVIRVARYNDHDVRVHFIYLRASEEILLRRVQARKGHFMKPAMVRSQLETLEEPETESDVFPIDVSGPLREVEALATEALSQALKDD